MTATVYIDFFNDEVEVENPEKIEDWVSALLPLCEDFAEKNYRSVYYNDYRGGLSEDTMKKVALAVFNSIQEYRSADIPESSGWHQTWNSILNCCLADVLEDFFEDNDQSSALHEAGFHRLYESLEEAMEEVDGPVCCAEAVYEQLKDLTQDKMSELDTSEPEDYIGNNPIPLAFTPDFNPDNQSRDDIMIYKESIETMDPLILRLLTLCRNSAEDLVDDGEIDYTNTELLEKWDRIANITFDHPPVISKETLKSVLDNMHNYGLPLWVGTISLRQLKQANFKETVFIEGGMVGSHDFINGAGAMEPVETYITISPSEYLTTEVGYTVKETYDPYARTLEARVIQDPKLKKMKVITMDNDNSPSI